MDTTDFPTSVFGEARRTIGAHGYVAYFPAPLPRSFELPARLVPLLADAEAALGRLAGVGQLLPNPRLLIRPYLLREAVASTMIEGTQASLAEIFELGAAGDQPNADVEEVLAYIDAMEWAVTEAPRLPLSNRMLLETHRRLLSGVRGAERRPGEFRTTQNWIGPPGSTLESASFVPPPLAELAAVLADRFRREGEAGLEDRSSAPARVPSRTPLEREQLIVSLRELRFSSPEIAETLAMPLSTVGAVLTRHGLGKLPRLQPDEPANSYERPRPGELVHIDVKKLGKIGRPGHRANGDRRTRTRGIGWEFVHVAVDDATRLAYVEVLDDEKGTTAAGFLRRATAFFRRYGIKVERVLTDNGSCDRAIVHALACTTLGIRHLRTRPYRPRTNGKAERFIRTLIDGWAYGAVYRTSTERADALAGWLDWYNRLRPHRSLARTPPLTRLGQLNNVVGSNT